MIDIDKDFLQELITAPSEEDLKVYRKMGLYEYISPTGQKYPLTKPAPPKAVSQDNFNPPKKSRINRDFVDSLLADEHPEVTENKAYAESSEINPKTGKPRKIFEAPNEYQKTQLVPEVLSEIEKQKPIGFIEGLTEDIEQKFPFSPVGALELADLMLASKRLSKEDYKISPIYHPAGHVRTIGAWAPPMQPDWTPERQKEQDIRVVNDYFDKLAEREKRGYTTAGKIGAGISILPAWMIEFAATGGLKKIASKGAQELVEKKIKSQVAKRAAGWAAGAAARTVGMPHRIAEQVLKRKMEGEN